MENIYAPRFQNEDAAREHLEALHWPDGPVCPHCESGNTKRLPPQRGRKTKAHPEGALRKGVVQCNRCRKQFTVTVGTVFESSKVPLHKWLLATHLIVSSKKGISAHQLHRMIGVTYKTAWFMAHRIREAMKPSDNGPVGGPGSDVEADETYYGKRPGEENNRLGMLRRNRIVSLVDRATGRATSIVFNGTFNANTLGAYLFTRVDRRSRLLTDEHQAYKRPGRDFAAHVHVAHARDEWVSEHDRTAHTNTVEGFFGIFKRGMRGIYQHCGQQHLARYLAEFDFRYSNRVGLGINDAERADIALKGISGKRLTYRRTNGLATA
ncbi:IS1595 family transposase [Qipengyuania sp.]|uniref:IS1595 family transposase n=1 Tax=Qipengyuania sp. TaxID=2004515 RepID=UPI003511A953